MKTKYFFMSCVLFIVSIKITYPQSTIREKLLFDFGWKFHLGDLTAAKNPSFDDTSWRSINLPHDWSIEGDFNSQLASCTGYLPGGFGWYRKTFDVPQNFEGKTITIQFDGVYCNSEVWINGKYIGKHPYGYTSFYYNITSCLEIGKKNVIAVRVDHMKYADTRWYSGSGIYRHVWLTIIDKIHVAQWGTQVLTPEVTSSAAKVTVKIIVANDNKVSKTIKLQSSLLTRDGKEVDKAETDIQVLDSLTSVDQAFSIHKPVLWNTENPY